jgi:hypothetical protein
MPWGILVTFMSHQTGPGEYLSLLCRTPNMPWGILVTFMSHLNSQDFVLVILQTDLGFFTNVLCVHNHIHVEMLFK